MRRSLVRLLLSIVCLIAATRVTDAQLGRGGAEWITDGADAQRSHWIPTDPKISPASLGKPGFQFLWKVKLNNDAVQLNSLTPAVLMDRYIGYRGFRSLAFLGGSSNGIYAIDTDLSRIEWQRRLPLPAPPAGSLNCPGGLTANIARETSAAYPAPGALGGGLGGRSGAARSDVGEGGRGAVTIAPAMAAAAAAAAAPASGRGNGLRLPSLIYAVAGDGTLRSLNISNGVEPEPPIKFVPPNSNASGLIVLDGIAYAATPGCNGAGGIWALDLATKQVNSWQPSHGTIAGSAGPAFGPDGTVFATTTAGELVSLTPGKLHVKNTWTTGGQDFASSPVVFPWKGKTLVAAASKRRINLFDSSSASGAPAVSDLPGSASGGLATWQDVEGNRWVVAPAAGAIAAFKIVDRSGTISLEQGWVSRDMISPLTPIVINGIVFAVSSGEFRSDDSKLSAAQRAQRSSPAVLYALDGATGKVLWDSGKTMTSFVHSGGLSGGAGQLYLQTWDQTIYAFGFPMEH
jgi:hypothetical protein